jgi:hypothetical protein
MESTMTEEHLAKLDQSLADPMWDDAFWTALEVGEERAKKALMDLYDESYEGYGCSCDTCVVRTVLESVWPELTEQFNRLVAIKAPVQTLGGPGGCGGNCACKRKE